MNKFRFRPNLGKMVSYKFFKRFFLRTTIFPITELYVGFFLQIYWPLLWLIWAITAWKVSKYRVSVRIWENTDQKKLRILKFHATHCFNTLRFSEFFQEVNEIFYCYSLVQKTRTEHLKIFNNLLVVVFRIKHLLFTRVSNSLKNTFQWLLFSINIYAGVKILSIFWNVGFKVNMKVEGSHYMDHSSWVTLFFIDPLKYKIMLSCLKTVRTEHV